MDRDFRINKCGTFEDLISKYTKVDIMQIAKVICGLKGISKLKKAELASKVGAILGEEEKMRADLLAYPDYVLSLIEDLAEGVSFDNEVLNDPFYRAAIDWLVGDCYIIFNEEAKSITVVEEFLNYFAEIKETDFISERKNVRWLLDCLYFADIFYAAVTEEVLLKMVQVNDAADLKSIQDIEYYYNLVPQNKRKYVKADNYWIKEEIKGNLPVILQMLNNKPYYIPTEEEVSTFAAEGCFPFNEHFKGACNFLTEKCNMDKDQAFQMIKEIQQKIYYANAPSEAFNVLNDTNVIFKDQKEAQVAMEILMELWSNTPMFKNRGYTPKEMHKLINQGEVPAAKGVTVRKTEEERIGRNDLCPCGSGKKYKKCCGR